jgi:hypothetical protein
MRRVNFPEPTTTAYFSPPTVPSVSSCDSDDGDSPLPSELPETTTTSARHSPPAATPHPDHHPRGSHRAWGRSSTDLSRIPINQEEVEDVDSLPSVPAVLQPQPARGLEVLVSYEVAGVAPFLVFLLGLPFMGVATHTGTVGAFGHGLKRGLGGLRIEGANLVCPLTFKRWCWEREEREVVVEVPQYGVEYTAYGMDDGREVRRPGRRRL